MPPQLAEVRSRYQVPSRGFIVCHSVCGTRHKMVSIGMLCSACVRWMVLTDLSACDTAISPICSFLYIALLTFTSTTNFYSEIIRVAVHALIGQRCVVTRVD